MSIETVATNIIAEACGTDFVGFGIVYTFSPILRRIPNRRHHAQEKEQFRLLDMVAVAVQRLQEEYDVDAATMLASDAGFGDSIVVTSSPEQLLYSVAGRLRAGDNVWDAKLIGDDVVLTGFWHDKSHRRVY